LPSRSRPGPGQRQPNQTKPKPTHRQRQRQRSGCRSAARHAALVVVRSGRHDRDSIGCSSQTDAINIRADGGTTEPNTGGGRPVRMGVTKAGTGLPEGNHRKPRAHRTSTQSLRALEPTSVSSVTSVVASSASHRTEGSYLRARRAREQTVVGSEADPASIRKRGCSTTLGSSVGSVSPW
jgi:hypothetical protein